MTAQTLAGMLDALAPLLGAGDSESAGWMQIIPAAEIERMAAENAVGEVPGTGATVPWRAPLPTVPLIVTGTAGSALPAIQTWLCRYYPPEHEVQLVGAGASDPGAVPLGELNLSSDLGAHTVLFVPPVAEMENVRTFAGMMQLTRRLRGPGGCPWDREQSHATLKPYLLEETYEVLDALDGGEPKEIAEELGDLLYQITIHAQVAAEAGSFTIEDVIESIMVKLIGRHPHVFGDLELESAQDVRHAWESFKQRQKPKRESVLEEIPRGLPALPQSNLMQKRAASVGFCWPGLDEVVGKVSEELAELRAEVHSGGDKERQREELGDLLFALVGVARHLRIDPEEALRGSNRKFATRFAALEAAARKRNTPLREMSPEEMLALWREGR